MALVEVCASIFETLFLMWTYAVNIHVTPHKVLCRIFPEYSPRFVILVIQQIVCCWVLSRFCGVVVGVVQTTFKPNFTQQLFLIHDGWRHGQKIKMYDIQHYFGCLEIDWPFQFKWKGHCSCIFRRCWNFWLNFNHCFHCLMHFVVFACITRFDTNNIVGLLRIKG